MKYDIDCLVTTYNFSEERIIEMLNSMNLFCHTIVRNQCPYNSTKQIVVNNQIVEIINANDIGTSKNRNELIKMSNAEYIIFCDDDEVFEENIIANISKRIVDLNFECLVLNVDGQNFGRNPNRIYKGSKIKKCRWHDISSTGVWRLLIKRKIALEILFDERIGPGTKYLCGEDTLFLSNVYKKYEMLILNLKLATIYSKASTWFEKTKSDDYFCIKGYIYSIIYPSFYKLFCIRFLLLSKQFSIKNYKLCKKGKWMFRF